MNRRIILVTVLAIFGLFFILARSVELVSEIGYSPNKEIFSDSKGLLRGGGYVCDVSILSGATCLSDADANGVVNAGDRGVISANIGQTSNDLVCLYDLDGNGVVNAGDRGIVSANIGLCSPLPDFQDGSGMNGGNPDTRFICGNNKINDGEICDGDNLDGESCNTLNENFVGGEISCSDSCDFFDVSLCYERTADLPDSWLVLYNLNSPESVEWMQWYISQRGIPNENTLGLDTSLNERINLQEFNDTILNPVKDYLEENPEIEDKIMGIIVGFRVPGNFYNGTLPPGNQGGGGWSVSSFMQNLNVPPRTSSAASPMNGLFFSAVNGEYRDKIRKSDLGSGKYLSARIDAPTLEDAKNLTLRAINIHENSDWDEIGNAYYRYFDTASPAGPTWYNLFYAVTNETFNNGNPYRWVEIFNGNTFMNGASFRFSHYKNSGWTAVQMGSSEGQPLGARVLGYEYSSWGATTVRSTSAHNGRFVPNALYRGNFASAMGATGEPGSGAEPDVSTMLLLMREGRTLGESVFLSQRRTNWMWEVVGDPFLTIQ